MRYTVKKITLQTVPLTNQAVELRIRKDSDPDMPAYQTFLGEVMVQPTGFLVEPFLIDGLLENTRYVISAFHACSGSSAIVETGLFIYVSELAFVRNNCPPFFTGESVLFSKTYTSNISFADAVETAGSDLEYNPQGQQYANTIGLCTQDFADVFDFIDVTNAEINTEYLSDIKTVTGLTIPVPISIGAGFEYRINSGVWTSASGTISNNQTVQIKTISSGNYVTGKTANLNINGVIIDYIVTTKAAVPVTVNYSLTKDTNPHVDAVIVPLVNGVNQGNIYPTSSGNFPGIVSGDSVYMGLVHQTGVFPWPSLAGASMVITKDAVEIYNSGLQINPNLDDLGNFTFTAEEGSVYLVTVVSNSDSIDYVPVSISFYNNSTAPLTTDSGFPVVSFKFIDNTDSLFKLNTAQYQNPHLNVGMNWLNDAGTGRLVIINNSTVTLDFTLALAGGGGYSATITIAGGGATGAFETIPKTGYDVTYVDSVPTYGNVFMSDGFTKNDCAAGSTGTPVAYEVPAGTFTAATQADADAAATANIAANGQTYANTNGTCLNDTSSAIVSLDMYNDTLLDVCAYIDTPGVSQSGNIVARDGLNFYPLTAVSAPETAYLLASDNIDQVTLHRRFEFNIARLINEYPNDVAIPQFIFKIRGRTQGSAGSRGGQWQREYPTSQMTMQGGPGTYIPSTAPSGGPAADPWTANVISGGDGSVGVAVGDVILTITYDRATDVVTVV